MWKVGYFLSCIAVARSFSSLPSCSSDEAELTGKRLQTLAAFNSVFTSFGASDVFSLDSFLSELGPLVTPEFTTTEVAPTPASTMRPSIWRCSFLR